MYVHSKYLIYRLRNQKKQPKLASNNMNTGNVMNRYLTYTFFLVLINYSIFLGFPMPRDFYFQFSDQIEKPDTSDHSEDL
jgi:hypothetical protein